MSKGLSSSYVSAENIFRHYNSVALSGEVVSGHSYFRDTKKGLIEIFTEFAVGSYSDFRDIRDYVMINRHKFPIPRYLRDKIFPKPLRYSLNATHYHDKMKTDYIHQKYKGSYKEVDIKRKSADSKLRVSLNKLSNYKKQKL